MSPALVGTRGQFSDADHENVIPSLNGSPVYVDGVYVNIRVTSDDVPVLMHDSTVDRTTDGTGAVDSLTLAQIQALDAGGGAQVPTLAEYLDAILALIAAGGRRAFTRIFLNPRATATADVTAIHGVATDAAYASIEGDYSWVFGDIHKVTANLSAAEDLRSLDAAARIASWVGPGQDEVPTAIAALQDAAVDGETLLLSPRSIYWPNPALLDTVVAAGLEAGVSRVSGFINAALPLVHGDPDMGVAFVRACDTVPYWNTDGTVDASLIGHSPQKRSNPSHVMALWG